MSQTLLMQCLGWVIHVIDEPWRLVGHVQRSRKTGRSVDERVVCRGGRWHLGLIDLSRQLATHSRLPRCRSCSFQNLWPHRLVALLSDADLDTMRSGAVPAGMREFSIDHAIAPHVSMNEFPRSSGIDAAADIGPMHVRNIVETITSLAIIVPLTAYANNLLGFTHNRDRSIETNEKTPRTLYRSLRRSVDQCNPARPSRLA